MAGTIALESLFLAKFISVNEERYADEPDMLALFTGLQLGDIVISDLNPGVPEAQTATVSSTARNFRGIQQAWLPAFLDHERPFTLLNPGAPLADIGLLDDQTVPGAYGYLDAAVVKVGLVLPSDTEADTLEAKTKEVFQGSFKYVIADSELTVTETEVSITLNAYVRGSLPHVIAAVPVMVIPPTDYGRLEWPEA